MPFAKEIITSRQNPTVVKLCALLDKKERRKTRLFRIDGHKLVSEAIDCGAYIDIIAICSEKADRLMPLAEKSGAKTVLLSPEVFSKITEEKAPDGIIAVVKYIDEIHKELSFSEIPSLASSDKRIMAFESLRDPGNLGTVIRSAAALSMERLIISADSAELYNPKTVRASMGTLFGMNVDVVDSLPRAAEILKGLGRRVFAAALDREAVGLDKLTLKASDCFAVGNEGHGLTYEMLAASTGKVFIPITEGAESLNAAAAAAILLWEHRRQTV